MARFWRLRSSALYLADMLEFTVAAVRGRLEFIDDPDTLQMFRLTDARLAE